MSRRFNIILVTILCFLFSACTVSPQNTNDEQEIINYPAGDPKEVAAVILHTNDVHVAFEDNIGYDGLALYKKELEALYDHVFLVDAGDAIQGGPIAALSKGKEIIKMMNEVGYDLAVTGNHEFDFGFDELDDRSEELNCGYTSANFCTSDGEPVFAPWRILDAGDIKIGFIGATTPDTYTKSLIKDIVNEAGEPMYDFLADETGEKLVGALQKYIDEVKANGADYVVLVSHLGSDDSVTHRFRCDVICPQLSGLDMIIDGHSHQTFNQTIKDKDGKEVLFAQTGTKLKNIGQVTIYKDGHLEEELINEVPKPQDLAYETVTRGKSERYVDPQMTAFMDGITASYTEIMERKIGELAFDMIVRDENGFDISRVQENNLGDLAADAFMAAGESDAALLVAGSIRNDLHKGDLTYGDILNASPYCNDVVTVKVKGQVIIDALEHSVSKLPDVSSIFPQVAGMSFNVNKEIPSPVKISEKGDFVSIEGERRVSDIKIGGKAVDPDKDYLLAITNYVHSGGDGFTMFVNAELVKMTMLSDYEALMQYIEEDLGGVIPDSYRETAGRINFVENSKTENKDETK